MFARRIKGYPTGRKGKKYIDCICFAFLIERFNAKKFI